MKQAKIKQRAKLGIKEGERILKNEWDDSWFLRLLLGVVVVLPFLMIVFYGILVFIFQLTIKSDPPSNAILFAALASLVIILKFFLGISWKFAIFGVLIALAYGLLTN